MSTRDNTYWGASAPDDRTAQIALTVNNVDFESAFAELRDTFEQLSVGMAEFADAELEKYELSISGAAQTIAYRVRSKVNGKQHSIITVYAVPDDRKSAVQFTVAGSDDSIEVPAVARSS